MKITTCFAAIVAATILSACPPRKTISTDPVKSGKVDSIQPVNDGGGSENFFAHRWVLSELNGKPVSTASKEKEAFLLFFPGQVSRVSGSTGCSRLNGTFELSATRNIRFSPLATTRKACAEGDVEPSILNALRGATNYSFNSGILTFLHGNKALARFKAENASAEAQENKLGSLDERYRRENKRLLDGIDFSATGNEPFWLVEIDLKKSLKFKLMDGDSVLTPIPKPIRLQGVAATAYRATTEKGTLQVVVYDKPCINSMSGDTVAKTVEVTWKNEKYSGCGKYLADYRLHDIWVLKSINDTAVNAEKLQRGVPLLELNLTKAQVSGHTGCNGFGGTLEVTGRTLSFLRLIGTQMYCEDGGFEKRYYKLLSQEKMPYQITKGLITLTSGNTKLTYKKVD